MKQQNRKNSKDTSVGVDSGREVVMGNITYKVHRTFNGSCPVGDLIVDCLVKRTDAEII